MTFDSFLSYYQNSPWPSNWRRGQTLFNALWDKRPDLAGKIKLTLVDPFYYDDRIEPALVWIKERW